MKVVVIGATGTIGSAVAAALEQRDHEVVKVSHRSGDERVDITDSESIEAMFRRVPDVDAVVTAAGDGQFGAMAELSSDDYALGLQHKLMGQVNVVRIGMNHVEEGTSFTLTSGVLSREPMPGSTALAMANGGLEGFVKAAALDLAKKKLRINVVSPIWVKETMIALGMDPTSGMSAADTTRAYVRSVEGTDTGELLDVRKFV
jgi:NAD(P)-dependent dehydrogenase (short-subunit alcohol dehydrogenase family)